MGVKRTACPEALRGEARLLKQGKVLSVMQHKALKAHAAVYAAIGPLCSM